MSERNCRCSAVPIEAPATTRTIKLKLDLDELVQQLRALADALDRSQTPVAEQVRNTHTTSLRDEFDAIKVDPEPKVLGYALAVGDSTTIPVIASGSALLSIGLAKQMSGLTTYANARVVEVREVTR